MRRKGYGRRVAFGKIDGAHNRENHIFTPSIRDLLSVSWVWNWGKKEPGEEQGLFIGWERAFCVLWWRS